uniref:Uncharacterized protein n=1 Tax=Avena sativa TaxID=4498 RepID=A0ACD5YEZ3_AVESA
MEIEYDMPGFMRLHKSGRVERFTGTETVPPSPSGDPATGVASKDIVLDPAANVTARLYLPDTAKNNAGKKLPVVVFFHGGAFFLCSAASPMYHRYAASLAAAVPAVFVSVNYRLAPEHPLPAAYDDAFAALKAVVAACRPDNGAEPWLAAHGDASRLCLVGDSAGANMAHNTAIRLRKEGIGGYGDRVSGVALMHSYFWGTEPLASPLDAPFDMDRVWDVACGGRFGRDHRTSTRRRRRRSGGSSGAAACWSPRRGAAGSRRGRARTWRGSRRAGGRARSSSTRPRARGTPTSCSSPTATMPSGSSPSWPISSGAVESALPCSSDPVSDSSFMRQRQLRSKVVAPTEQ